MSPTAGNWDKRSKHRVLAPFLSKHLPDLNELHRYARAIFDHALSSVDPGKAVKQAISVNGPIVDIGEARLLIVTGPTGANVRDIRILLRSS